MYQVVFFAVLLTAASAGYIGAGHGGSSVSSRRQDDFGNYAFNYQIVDGLGATNGRAEVGDAWGNKRGSYNIGDIDGRARRVEYVADGAGFRAVVKTNEPGTALSAPAAAVVASPRTGPISGTPAVIAHAPVAAVAPAAAVARAAVVAPAAVGFAPAVAAAPLAAGVVAKGAIGAPFGAGFVGAPFAAGVAAAPFGHGVIGGLGYKGFFH